jgi:polar amino acid transport system substrate-binding protein
MRKKLFVLIIIVVNCIAIIGGFSEQVSNAETSNNIETKDRLEAIKEKGVLTVASSNDVPFAYIDAKTNKFSGVDAEIIIEVARRLGINKVEMKKVPFENLISELNNNDNIDMVIDGFYVTEDRKKEVLFTDVWYKAPESIITLKVSKIAFKEDLKNAVVGVQKSTAFVELAEKWKKDGLVKEVKIFGSKPELLLAVNNGEVDASITDSVLTTQILSTSEGLYLKALAGYKPELSGMVAAAVRKSDITLADAVNKKVDEMKKDRTLDVILKKYRINESK